MACTALPISAAPESMTTSKSGMALTQELEQSHAVHARQAHIQKDKIPLALRHHNQGGLRIKSHPGLYAAQIPGVRPGAGQKPLHHPPAVRAWAIPQSRIRLNP